MIFMLECFLCACVCGCAHLNFLIYFHGNIFLFQALSGVGGQLEDRASVTNNTALTAALNTQFIIQIGIFTAVPMILGFILEQGFLRVITCYAYLYMFGAPLSLGLPPVYRLVFK